MDSKHLKIALLVCDTTYPIEGGDYRIIVPDWLDRALEHYQAASSTKIKYEMNYYDVIVKGEYPNLDHYDAVIITGSGKITFRYKHWIE